MCIHALSWACYLFWVYVSHIFATLVKNNFEAFDFSFYLLMIQAHLMALPYELHFSNCLQKHTAGLFFLIDYYNTTKAIKILSVKAIFSKPVYLPVMS